MTAKGLSPTKDIIADIAAGRMVIIVDDEGRENEGDIVVAAECVTSDAINFMALNARGLICMPMAGALVDRLGLRPMVEHNQSSQQTAFTVSIGAKRGITTGISAGDRALTVKVAISSGATPDDVVSPGHIFPLRAHDDGVLARPGHTEAAVDLARLAGFSPAGVICEVMNADGSMARMPDLLEFAARHGLKIGTIADIIAYRQKHKHGEAA